MEPKHGGCYVCKTTTVPLLVSVPAFWYPQGTGLYSLAVCPPCYDILAKGR